ncbi:ATP-binding protein [Bacteroides acidifaciens]|uniref:ATP-binding protein n=9 Tax=Bacteroidales TaxID=171549 RepID=A0A4S2A7E8_9BACE|nr:ATP-binding protein [Bacteroides acidifaciens]TGX96417.1 ATP-binding protein [Bacteroides acidifaciens]
MYKELVNGTFVPQDISYPTLMKKHVKKHSSYFQPIFEAISNSLEATSGKDDVITIRINKAKTLNQEQYSFLSVDIIDTGIGFNDDNFGRLRRLYDESKGQNNFGTGRVQYLHFFNNTDIYSVFEEEGLKYKRRIVLSKNFYATQKSVIWSSEKEVVDIATPIGTMVSFYYPLNDEDQEKYNELTTIELRDRILIHYLSRFCLNRDNLQQIKLECYINSIHNKDSDQIITGKDIPQPDYTDSVQVNYSKISVDGNTIIKTPNTEEFIINSYSLPCSIQKRNEVKLTSKNETVEVSGIDFSLIKDSPKINNSYLLFLISSSYLTQQDSDLRGQLAIYSRKDFLKKRNLFSGEEQILTDDIEEKVTSSITTHYKSISKVKESFEAQIDELAEMFSLDRTVLNEVGYKAGDSDQSILKKVYEYNADISAKHDAGIKSVMDSLKELTPSSKDFKKKLNEKVKKVSELVPQINRTELVRYISKRKIILDLMQKTLDKQLDCQQKNSKGKKINHESFLHNILFSQHSDNPLDSNLWMINDDFIHYKGISESELRNIKVGSELFFREDLTKEELEELTAYNRDKLGNRPDILLFPKEHKCIIIELKSMDADVSKFVSQVSQYAGLIRQYAKERFEITTFYAYLIGESFTLSEVKRANPFFKKAYYFDYLFCPNYPVDGGENRRDGEMYIEVIKYSTLLERAVVTIQREQRIRRISPSV